MLDAKTKKSIAALLKIPEDKLQAALASDKEIAIEGWDPEAHGLVALTQDELATRDLEAVRTKTRELQDAGMEIAIKKMKQAIGFEEYQGKDPAAFAAAIKENVLKVAKLQPSEQLLEKDKQITALTSARDEALKARDEAVQSHKAASLERDIISQFPARDGSLEDSERLLLFRSRYEPQDVENVGTVWKDKSSGKELRGTDGKPLAVKDVLSQFWQAKKWEATPAAGGKAGRGAGSEGGPSGSSSKPVKYSEAAKQWQEQNKHINDPGFQTWVGQLASENASFEMDLTA